MSDKSISDWDPRDASVLRDQCAAYDEMRERCPVAHSDFLGWSIFRHADVVNILSDPETFSNATRRRHIPNGMDPPEHTRYRRALEPYFVMEQMDSFEPRFRSIAANLVQKMLSQDEAEFVSGFADPFSAESLCVFLGWPSGAWKKMSGWIHGNQQAALSRDREVGKRLALELAGYVTEAITERREAGVDEFDDITASLMKTEVEGKPLSDDNIVSILRNWTAGHGTVSAGIGLLMLYLAEHQDVQQELRHTPALLPSAIDEILRVEGPLVANNRTTTRDVEIGGREIDAGDSLTLMWIAANRDERAFDDPETVRFHRDHAGTNLLFGAGIHDCVGAPLARLEMRIAMEELLNHTSAIELAGAQPPSRAVYPGNGLESMNIRLVSA